MEPGTVVSFCDRTGNMVRPWREAGYRAITVDLQEAPAEPMRGLRHHIIADVRVVSADAIRRRALTPIVAVFAFPPCTNLSVSGARWFKSKGLSGLIEGLEIVNACRELCEALGAPWMLENPVSTLATYWRKSDYRFQPKDYTAFERGDHYTKLTCLWTGNGFVMPPKAEDPSLADVKPDNRIHAAPPSDDRGDIRSETPMGFARAVFQANAKPLAMAAE